MSTLGPKRIAESNVQLAQLMEPSDANVTGNVHGGTLMKLADTAGAITAVRHAGGRVVTVEVDSMTFLEPVHVGDLLLLQSRITWVGRSSMETEVIIDAENIRAGTRRRVSTAFLVFVGLGEDGRPREVPPLLLETDEDRRVNAEAAERRAHRLAVRPS